MNEGGAAFREVERKYDPGTATAGALRAAASMTGEAGVAAVSQQDDQVLDAVYYDTKDLRLIRNGITLRRRTGGEDAGWHLKLPAGADTRNEIRAPLTSAAGAPGVPATLAALVRAYTRGSALTPVVRIRTARATLRLLDASGRALAEIATDHVSAGRANEPAAVWDEMEVELVAGDRELLMAVDARLRAAGARPAAAATKLERALGDRLTAARQAARDEAGTSAPLTKQSPAGDVVLAYLRLQVRAITRYDPLVRRDEPDAVHQMRVATRRARSALQAFGTIVERAPTVSLRDELKWLATVLGHARDSEVMRARLTGELARIPPDLVVGPVGARIAAHFGDEYKRAHAAAVRVLDGQRYLRLLDALDALVAEPPLTPLAAHTARKVLAKPVRRAARRLEHALAAVDSAEDTDAAIHEARKAAKRARYAAEAAGPALGGKAARQARRAKTLQTMLGDHHDSVVARAVLLGIVSQAREAAEDTFSYGLIYERQACQARDIERALPAATRRKG